MVRVQREQRHLRGEFRQRRVRAFQRGLVLPVIRGPQRQRDAAAQRGHAQAGRQMLGGGRAEQGQAERRGGGERRRGGEAGNERRVQRVGLQRGEGVGGERGQPLPRRARVGRQGGEAGAEIGRRRRQVAHGGLGAVRRSKADAGRVVEGRKRDR
jgi:hypothetical protein